MTPVTKDESGWLLTRVWVNAIETTARDFYGTRPKEFCMRAYEHATDSWLKILEDEYGIYTPKADTLLEAIKHYITSGVEGGLFESESMFELTELASGGVRINVKHCPYMESCHDLLERKKFSLKTLTCAHIGCFRAAGSLLANRDSSYEIVDVKPGMGCEGIINPM